MKRLRRFRGLALLGVGAMALAGCETEVLGNNSCGTGEFCVWQSANYQQGMSAYDASPFDFANHTYSTDNGRIMNDDISSAKNKGETCDHKLWSNNGHVGTPRHISHVSPGKNYDVPDLTGSLMGNDEASSSEWEC